jgi:hypothetical protein
LGYSRLLNNNIQCSGNNEEFSELITTLLAQTRILSIRFLLLLLYRILIKINVK